MPSPGGPPPLYPAWGTGHVAPLEAQMARIVEGVRHHPIEPPTLYSVAPSATTAEVGQVEDGGEGARHHPMQQSTLQSVVPSAATAEVGQVQGGGDGRSYHSTQPVSFGQDCYAAPAQPCSSPTSGAPQCVGLEGGGEGARQDSMQQSTLQSVGVPTQALSFSPPSTQRGACTSQVVGGGEGRSYHSTQPVSFGQACYAASAQPCSYPTRGAPQCGYGGYDRSAQNQQHGSMRPKQRLGDINMYT